ncbi:flagellar motor switch protein FliG [Pararhodobacter oceanensis]|uniref:Flagellar motor switch protein FliG n=1 Tax=Pararhodobacter oceanensis TaxID=2172121 RepID=A0A2T8HTN0_9RHOB|nr:FliG C-terminal domain-containing protein [Pararhodobacter oceanensis]PVH28746.1 flagellar motor switch protein FliG [Pararhodobacter oceanensis]
MAQNTASKTALTASTSLGGHAAAVSAADGKRYGTSPAGRRIPSLSGRQKAAIMVRLLLSEGADLKLNNLPEDIQTALTEQLGDMRLVDRDTMSSVVTEFVETLEQVGLSFPGGIEGALKALDGRLSPGAALKLQKIARTRDGADPWNRILAADAETLLDVLEPESAEVAAVVVSKLPVARAAELLGKMPGERARRVAYAVALTEGIAPAMVDRIGSSIALELDGRPPRAFAISPAARVGAILNSAAAPVRQALLDGLSEKDEGFADVVRKNIFTFAHIHERLGTRDVPKVLREVEQGELITALAAALPLPDTDEGRTAEFLLANMSQRMAATLRDEVEARGRVKMKEAESAMANVVAALRDLADSGEITLLTDDDDED